MKRTPWFNARRDPPVNGTLDSQYEWRCGDGLPTRQSKGFLRNLWCASCQWRGLTAPAKERK
jgi:hypothetical protein